MDITKLFDENEKPLDTLLDDGGFSGIFRTVACIGDSLSSGEFEIVSADGERSWHDMYEYSWGQFLARMNGSKVYNFSRGGMTAKVYCESFAAEKGFLDKEKAAQAYIIAMGVNDISTAIRGNFGLGDITDVDINDHRNNKDTFVGYYAKMIQIYKEIQPDAFFFLVTIPRGGTARLEYENRHAEIMYELSKMFSNVFVIDLRKYAPVYDTEFKEKFFLTGHMNPMGYLLTAKMMASYIDYIIRHNMKTFERVGFIGNSGIQVK